MKGSSYYLVLILIYKIFINYIGLPLTGDVCIN